MIDLPVEIILEILDYCPIESVLEMGQVNSYFNRIVNSNTVWRSLLKKLERFSRFPGCHVEDPERAFKELYALSKTGFYDWIYLPQSAVSASSTDHEQQSIGNVLLNDTGFWSSAGSPDVNSNEEIVLSLIGLSLISCIRMKPYRAAYQVLSPIYAPQALQVYVGVNGKNWVEIPMVFPVENTNDLQTFDVSDYCTVGDSVKLVLQKRQQQQREDGLWYTVLEKVDVYGIAVTESMPYLANMVCKETPRYVIDPPLSYSQGLEVISSFGKDFNRLFTYVIQTPPYGTFRNSEILPIVWADRSNHRKLRYFDLLVNTRTGHPWTDYESIEFIKHVISVGKVDMIRGFFGDEIQLTEKIGDLVFDVDPELALAIYSERSCMDKMLKCLIHLNRFLQAFNLLNVVRYPQSHYRFLMSQMPLGKSKEFAKVWIRYNPNAWQLVADALEVSYLNTQETFNNWLYS